MSTPPFSEDALTRYRVTHPDRDLRPLLRRLHRLPFLRQHLLSTRLKASSATELTAEETEEVDDEVSLENELVRLEVMKWRAGVEKTLAGVRNLERQKEGYLRLAEETRTRTEELRVALEEEKAQLEVRLKEREHQIRCDEIAAQIMARGHTRKELDEQIANLEQSITEHRASHAAYLQTAQSRIDTFSAISKLVEDVRAAKLPVDNTQADDEPQPQTITPMEIDEPVVIPKLSAQALPFQPKPAPQAKPAHLPARPTPTAPASANLPKLPSSGTLAPPPSRVSSSTLPSRPSALRSSTVPGVARGRTSLEEGEVSGEEDGEVAESGGSRRVRRK